MESKIRPRIELQTLLEGILGSKNVYFQPPESMRLTYPCIVYERDAFASTFAENQSYIRRMRYSLKLIDKNSDSSFLEAMADIPYCRHTRHYVTDNLNHDVFELYW